MSKVILDISHHETVKDWKELKESVSFLIIKAVQGTDFLDPHCYNTIKNCEKYKIPYWLYVFLEKGNELAQAKYMIAKTKGEIGKYFVGYCLDAEYGSTAKNVKTALDYIKKHSKKTMLYTAHHYYHLYKDLVKNLGENCAWWEPRYSSSGPHKGVDLWQYSENYVCPYISGKVDINRLHSNKYPLSWYQTPLVAPTQPTETKSETVKPKVSYYPKYTGKSTSIVDALKAVGVKDPSKAVRKKIAQANGIPQYNYTASQNKTLLTLLKAGKLKKV